MLRTLVMDFDINRDDYFYIMEFSFNNNYNISIQNTPSETLYYRNCRSPIVWFKFGEITFIGLKFFDETMEKV